MYEKKILTILQSVFTIRVYFKFFVSCQKCVFDNLDRRDVGCDRCDKGQNMLLMNFIFWYIYWSIALYF